MNVTLKQLRYFVALAETGNFGRAAERVHVTQPALSLQIKELEDRLGTRLVERLPRELRLTRAGQDLLVRARAILAQVSDLELAARWNEGLRGRLNLGVIPTVAPYVLPRALGRIRAQDLTLELRIREARTETLLDELRGGRLDAVVMAEVPGMEGTVQIALAEDRFLLAGSRARIEAWASRSERLRPREVDPDLLLLLDEGHCLADQALEVCGLAARRQVDLGASSLATLAGLVAAGFGLTLLPEIALRTERAAAPGLSFLRFAAPEPARRLVLVRREGSADTGWDAGLAALLREAIADLLDGAQGIAPSGGPE